MVELDASTLDAGVVIDIETLAVSSFLAEDE